MTIKPGTKNETILDSTLVATQKTHYENTLPSGRTFANRQFS